MDDDKDLNDCSRKQLVQEITLSIFVILKYLADRYTVNVRLRFTLHQGKVEHFEITKPPIWDIV